MEINIKPSKITTSFKTEKIYPKLEELTVIPSVDEQNYNGAYGEVTIQGVTSDIDEDIKPENIKTGVNILGVDGGYEGIDTSDATATPDDILYPKTAYVNNELVEGTIQEYDGSYTGNTSTGIKITDASYLFYYGARTEYLNEILALCENVRKTFGMFYYCDNLKQLDLSKFDTSSTTNMGQMFDHCRNLTQLDLSNFNTRNVTDLNHMFYYCKKLTQLDLSGFDVSSVINIHQTFSYCSNVTDLKSFKNLGKGYIQKSNNYLNYKLDLSACTELTHESLVDVINNGLYDLNLTYNVANGGTLYRQSLVLGTTNLAKLTTEEIAIATNKGWDVT